MTAPPKRTGTKTRRPRITPPAVAPFSWRLGNPGPFLRFLTSNPAAVDLRKAQRADVWALVGLAALARLGQPKPLPVEVDNSTAQGRFALAIGFKDAVAGTPAALEGEAGRTVRIQRLTRFAEVETRADAIGKLILPFATEQEARQTIYYVLVELIRNVLQHSQDRLGAVIGAQLMDKRQGYAEPVIQVAVADVGVGIYEAIRRMHPDVTDARVAVEKAMRAHISGTFGEGLTGTSQNAGMGLFFISEMAKLTGGRLLVASRDAALTVQGTGSDGRHKVSYCNPGGTGFPGTLVAFEMQLDHVDDHDALIEQIRQRARLQIPKRAVHQWIRYEQPAKSAVRIAVRPFVEDAQKAEALARDTLDALILKKQTVALDFAGIDSATQSFLHALLFEPLRLAWALRVPIIVVNAAPAVVSAIGLLEEYGLGG